MRPLVLVLLVLSLAAPALGQAQTAVLPVLAYGVPSDEVGELERAVIDSVGDAAGGVMSAEDTALLLEAAEATVTCKRSELSCLVEIGGLMAVRRLVLARAELTDDGLAVVLTVIDVTEARARRRVRQTLTGAHDEQHAQLRTLVFRLFHDSAAVLGGLIVVVEEPGAQVFVDNVGVGTAPLPGPVLGLDAGTHLLRAELPDLPPVEEAIDVAPGAVVQVRLRVRPAVEEPPSGIDFTTLRVFGWSVVGFGTAGLALGLLGSAAGAGLTALALFPDGRFRYEVLAFAGYVYGCYDPQSTLPCSPDEVRRTRPLYDEVSGRTQVAAAIGVPSTAVAALSLGGVGAGVLLLLLARYTELASQLEASQSEGAAPPVSPVSTWVPGGRFSDEAEQPLAFSVAAAVRRAGR